jgi:hypothetical protein
MHLGYITLLVLVLLAPWTGRSQEVLPRRWSHLPMGLHVVGGGVAYSDGDVSFDPVLKIEDATVELTTFGAKYIRTFAFLGKSARAEVGGAYQTGSWEGLLDGQPAEAPRSGFTDPKIRFAVNLLGAPPLKREEFAAYRKEVQHETILGAGLWISLPLGEYYEDKLINLGENRFAITPQLGVVHTRGNWSGELTGALWCYTDNNDFLNGNKLEQDPLLAGQAHLIYSFRPGVWASASGAYGYGAKRKVNGENKNDRKELAFYALNFGLPFSPRAGVKFNWIASRTLTDLGGDVDTFATSFSYLW